MSPHDPTAPLTTTYNVLDAIAALTDAFVDVEAHAAFAQHAGVANPAQNPARAALGATYAAERQRDGTAALRAEIIELAYVIEDVWQNTADDAQLDVVWDFEFCPAALDFRFSKGLRGDALRDALRQWIALETGRLSAAE